MSHSRHSFPLGNSRVCVSTIPKSIKEKLYSYILVQECHTSGSLICNDLNKTHAADLKIRRRLESKSHCALERWRAIFVDQHLYYLPHSLWIIFNMEFVHVACFSCAFNINLPCLSPLKLARYNWLCYLNCQNK